MQVWSALVLAVAVLLGGYWVAGLRAGVSHRRHCRALSRRRGKGSFTQLAARMVWRCLSEQQARALYGFLYSYGAPGFDILPSDSLARDFGVGGRHGVPTFEFLDDLRALLDLPRDCGRGGARPETVADLVQMLDREAEAAHNSQRPG